jgi:hypothetical protein
VGRYVLLEFNDNIAADKFVEMLKASQEGTEGPMDRDVTAGMIAGAHSEVLAVYTKPAGLCSCKSDLDNSVRGRKFGWWVCPNCKKPKSGSGQTLRNTLNPKLEGTTRVGSPSLSVRWKFVDGKVITSIES